MTENILCVKHYPKYPQKISKINPQKYPKYAKIFRQAVLQDILYRKAKIGILF